MSQRDTVLVYVGANRGNSLSELYDKFDTETWSAYHNGDHYGYGNIRVYSKDKAGWYWRGNPDPNLPDVEDSVLFTPHEQRIKDETERKQDQKNVEGIIAFTLFFTLITPYSCNAKTTINNAKNTSFIYI